MLIKFPKFNDIERFFSVPETLFCIPSVMIQLVENLKKKIPANCIMTLDAPDGVSDTLKNFSNRVWSGNIFFLKWINQENK